MNVQYDHLVALARELLLSGMADALDRQRSDPQYSQMPFTERLAAGLIAEREGRTARRHARDGQHHQRLRAARIQRWPAPACRGRPRRHRPDRAGLSLSPAGWPAPRRACRLRRPVAR